MKIGILTLGCDKNTVDSEYFASELLQIGVTPVTVAEEPIPDDDQINGVLINTCGFIELSKTQSIAAILNWVRFKKTLKRKKRHFRIYVAGCLSQRYASELPIEIPEVDGWLGVGDFAKIGQYFSGDLIGGGVSVIDAAPDLSIRIGQGRAKPVDDATKYHAFLKIGDGCSHRCSFCAIPLIKGGVQISTPKEQIFNEAKELLTSGVRELCIVAQDSAAYGRDLYDGYGICELLRDLDALDFSGEWWIRLLYVYPAGLTDKLLKVIKTSKHIVHYVDVPLQHTDLDVLMAMRRPEAKIDISKKLVAVRSVIPDLTVRTTFIVGFPGETAKQFANLLDKVAELKFDRVGCFAYSLEENTDAIKIKPHISSRVAQSRLRRLMQLQERVSQKLNKALMGTEFRVLIEEKIESDRWVGRSWRDAPEVDGVVVVESEHELELGTFVTVKITGCDVHDLVGEVAL